MTNAERIESLERILRDLQMEVENLKRQLHIYDPEEFEWGMLEYDEDYYATFTDAI